MQEFTHSWQFYKLIFIVKTVQKWKKMEIRHAKFESVRC